MQLSGASAFAGVRTPLTGSRVVGDRSAPQRSGGRQYCGKALGVPAHPGGGVQAAQAGQRAELAPGGHGMHRWAGRVAREVHVHRGELGAGGAAHGDGLGCSEGSRCRAVRSACAAECICACTTARAGRRLASRQKRAVWPLWQDGRGSARPMMLAPTKTGLWRRAARGAGPAPAPAGRSVREGRPPLPRTPRSGCRTTAEHMGDRAQAKARLRSDAGACQNGSQGRRHPCPALRGSMLHHRLEACTPPCACQWASSGQVPPLRVHACPAPPHLPCKHSGRAGSASCGACSFAHASPPARSGFPAPWRGTARRAAPRRH